MRRRPAPPASPGPNIIITNLALRALRWPRGPRSTRGVRPQAEIPPGAVPCRAVSAAPICCRPRVKHGGGGHTESRAERKSDTAIGCKAEPLSFFCPWFVSPMPSSHLPQVPRHTGGRLTLRQAANGRENRLKTPPDPTRPSLSDHKYKLAGRGRNQLTTPPQARGPVVHSPVNNSGPDGALCGLHVPLHRKADWRNIWSEQSPNWPRFCCSAGRSAARTPTITMPTALTVTAPDGFDQRRTGRASPRRSDQRPIAKGLARRPFILLVRPAGPPASGHFDTAEGASCPGRKRVLASKSSRPGQQKQVKLDEILKN